MFVTIPGTTSISRFVSPLRRCNKDNWLRESLFLFESTGKGEGRGRTGKKENWSRLISYRMLDGNFLLVEGINSHMIMLANKIYSSPAAT